MNEVESLVALNDLINNVGMEKCEVTLVKYSTVACPKCRMLTPVLNSMSREFPTVRFVEVVLDKVSDPDSFGVTSVPTVRIYKSGVGEVVDLSGGKLNPLEIRMSLKKLLGE